MAKFVSAKQLSEVLDITERRVYQIASEKDIFPRDPSGKFNLFQCVYNFYEQKFIPNKDKLDYDKEHALLEKAKREKAELQLAKMRNELHDASDVERVLTNMLVTFRNRLLGIPSKIAPKLIGQRNISKISDIIDRELREVLTELSEYDPAMFADEDTEGEDVETEYDNTISEDT